MKGAELKQKEEEEEGFGPERNFRCVWSADAQAHSNTLQRRGNGEGV